MTPPDDFSQLRAVSARYGADPLLVQGPGGNTSVKQGDVMWIKASGTLLSDAETREIFVPVDLPSLNAAVEAGDPRADRAQEFALVQDGVRPSIERCLHSVFSHRIVLHVHCVNSIAIAVREDARALLAERLGGFDWSLAPYAKPGARLASLVRAARGGKADVIVLGNHGLIVAGESVEEAAARLEAVSCALQAPALPSATPDFARLVAVAGLEYEPAAMGHSLHTVALTPRLLEAATAGSLYPDHVVFCGAGATALEAGDDADSVAARFRQRGLASPPFLLASAVGALLRKDASASALALAQCLGDVLMRVTEGAPLNYLSDEETRELIDWDAEKYRKALHAA